MNTPEVSPVDDDIILQLQNSLEVRVRTAVQEILSRDPARDDSVVIMNRQVELGRRSVTEILKGTPVEALAVGTTFRAPHVTLSPQQERLWVRTEVGIMSLDPSRGTFLASAVNPLKIHSVQPPAEKRN